MLLGLQLPSFTVPGGTEAIVNMPDVWDVRYLELIGREVVPSVQELAA